MKLKKLVWYEIVRGLPGLKGDRNLKGMVCVRSGRKPFTKLYVFHPNGDFIKTEYLHLRSLKDPAMKKIAVPVWATKIYDVENPSAGIDGLYNATTKTFIDFTGNEERLSTWMRDIRRTLKHLHFMQAIK